MSPPVSSHLRVPLASLSPICPSLGRGHGDQISAQANTPSFRVSSRGEVREGPRVGRPWGSSPR